MSSLGGAGEKVTLFGSDCEGTLRIANLRIACLLTILRLAILSISITQECQPQLWYIIYTGILVIMLPNHPYIDMVVDNANLATKGGVQIIEMEI